MLSIKQRKIYAIVVGILFVVGLLLYGLLVGQYADPSALLVLLSGVIVAGIASGAFIVIRLLVGSKSTVLIVISCVLFALTIFLIAIIGIASLIPYYIYNLVILSKLKRCDDSVKLKKFVRTTRIIFFGVSIAVYVVSFATLGVHTLLWLFRDEDISEEIGFSRNSPDYYIIKEYYYSKHDKDYADNMQYTYDIENGVLFALIEKEGAIYDICEFKYYSDLPLDDYNSYMADLFSSTYAMKSKDVFAVTLVIDARSEEEHRIELAEFYGKNKVTDLLLNSNMDRKYADPDKIKLYSPNGELVPLENRNGKFIMYYATCKKSDADFNIKAVYEGQEAIILTYDDIKNYNYNDYLAGQP